MKFENFVVDCSDKMARGNVIVMDRSCYIWLGDAQEAPSMSSLVAALETKFGVLSSDLLATGDGEKASSLAQKLSRKFNIQTFVSYNLGDNYDDDRLEVERKLLEVLKVHFS